jgi:hypothetical protein
MSTTFAFAPRDLEKEMEAIYDAGLSDIESVVMRFAHGECHSLSCALHLTYQCPVIALIDVASGHPVHSFALLPNGLGFDAYGVHEPASIADRYHGLAGFNDMDELKAVLWTTADLSAKEWLYEVDTPEDILAEFSVLLEYIGLDLQAAYGQSWDRDARIQNALLQCNDKLLTLSRQQQNCCKS